MKKNASPPGAPLAVMVTVLPAGTIELDGLRTHCAHAPLAKAMMRTADFRIPMVRTGTEDLKERNVSKARKVCCFISNSSQPSKTTSCACRTLPGPLGACD